MHVARTDRIDMEKERWRRASMQYQDSGGYTEDRIMKNHKISLFNRGSGSISGVREVISFDLNEIILDTEQGLLMIHGEDLHVTRLTVEKGEVEIEGVVDSFVYSDSGPGKGEKGGIMRRLFR